jgi:hypothetical protein
MVLRMSVMQNKIYGQVGTYVWGLAWMGVRLLIHLFVVIYLPRPLSRCRCSWQDVIINVWTAAALFATFATGMWSDYMDDTTWYVYALMTSMSEFSRA